MKLLYSADLHGRIRVYKHVFGTAAKLRADALVLGGDIGPHASGEMGSHIGLQRLFIQTTLRDCLKRLKGMSPQTRVCIILGNEDWASNAKTLESLESEDLCSAAHNRRIELPASYDLIGYSCVPFAKMVDFKIQDWERRDMRGDPPPTRASGACVSRGYDALRVDSTKFFAEQPSIEDDLPLLPEPRDRSKAIYVMHSPPYETKCDMLRDGTHGGSRAIRAFIQQRQPALALHGHVHESPSMSGSWFDWVGTTLCVNMGSRPTRASLFELGEGGLERFTLVYPERNLLRRLASSVTDLIYHRIAGIYQTKLGRP